MSFVCTVTTDVLDLIYVLGTHVSILSTQNIRLDKQVKSSDDVCCLLQKTRQNTDQHMQSKLTDLSQLYDYGRTQRSYPNLDSNVQVRVVGV